MGPMFGRRRRPTRSAFTRRSRDPRSWSWFLAPTTTTRSPPTSGSRSTTGSALTLRPGRPANVDRRAGRSPRPGSRCRLRVVFRFFVTCARGTEGALRREIAAMRIAGAKGDFGGVWFEGPLEMGMRVCLHSRVGVRVLAQLGTFEATEPKSLYAGARAIPWRDWLTATSTFAVHASVRDTKELTHSGYVALKVKDAVADSLRDAFGERPNVDPKSPDVGIVLHLAAGKAGIFLDLAGESLHRRGYRVAMVDAPLKEALAAAVLILGGARSEEHTS